MGTSGSELTPAPPNSLSPCLESSQSSRSPSSTVSSCRPHLPTNSPDSVSVTLSTEHNYSLALPQYRTCLVCRKEFSADRFRSHTKCCKRRPCSATGCDKCFSDAGSLKRHERECLHVKRQQPPSKYQCLCHKTFARWDKFMEHHKRRICKAQQSSYVCQCGLEVASIEQFQIHHETEKGKPGRPRNQPRQP